MKQKFTIAYIFLIYILTTSFSTFAQINGQDSLALVSFYNSTDGANWKDHTNWLTAAPVNSWYGITTTNNRVLSLTLINNGLSGTIPSEFGNLTNLQSLFLSFNQLSGTIPSEFVNLTYLLSLDLSVNQLSGSIPPELGNLKLRSLGLSYNNLSGSIPATLGNLTDMESLSFGNNLLSGSIPSEFENLTSLKYLYLNNNQLSGAISSGLGNLKRLLELNLAYNHLSGSIPSELEGIKRLRNLYLNNNQLSGSIPPELGNLINLQDLYLNNNRLSGSIPFELGNIPYLYILHLNNNQLSESIPPELGNLINLQDLYLSNNHLSGIIPSEIGKLTNLYFLYLNNNLLSGRIPSELGNLSRLQQCHLDNNDLSDTTLLSLADIINKSLYLHYLSIHKNQFTFNGIEHLAEISSSLDQFTFIYAPQTTIALHNNGNILSVSAGGTLLNNTYNWYKNETFYLTIRGDSTLTIKEAGKYFVEVTNDIAADLTLNSDTINFDILPVVLLNFSAQKQKNTSLLQWQTTSEINNSYFSIERSSNSGNFTTIGKIDALNDANKNSYSFIDNIPSQGINYYRLKQVDKDGTFNYSKIVSTDFTDYSLLFSISPNPATNEVKIIIPKINSVSQAIVYDVTGRKIISQQIAANNNSTQINISSLSSGVYDIVLLQNGKQQNLKLIKK